jgi:hypothetical protein
MPILAFVALIRLHKCDIYRPRGCLEQRASKSLCVESAAEDIL